MRDDEIRVGPALSWRQATYRFGPPKAVAIGLFLAVIPVGAWYFAQEGFEELVEEREIGIEALMLLAAAGAPVFGLYYATVPRTRAKGKLICLAARSETILVQVRAGLL